MFVRLSLQLPLLSNLVDFALGFSFFMFLASGLPAFLSAVPSVDHTSFAYKGLDFIAEYFDSFGNEACLQ